MSFVLFFRKAEFFQEDKKQKLMETLRNLIQTLSLDHSLFYHLALAFILYFISKKWLFQPYISAMDRRKELTKGRLEKSGDRDRDIQQSRKLYEEKAQKIHKEFQELFSGIRDKALEHFSKESFKLEKDQKLWLEQEKKKLEVQAQKQNKILEKEIPLLKTSLLNKIKS